MRHTRRSRHIPRVRTYCASEESAPQEKLLHALKQERYDNALIKIANRTDLTRAQRKAMIRKLARPCPLVE